MPLNHISDRNPSLDEMKERGWAWIRVGPTGKHGAPYTDDDYGLEEDPETGELTENTKHGSEVRIIYWGTDA